MLEPIQDFGHESQCGRNAPEREPRRHPTKQLAPMPCMEDQSLFMSAADFTLTRNSFARALARRFGAIHFFVCAVTDD